MNNRFSNIELLRIVAMLLVVFVHANYFSLGSINIDDINNDPINSFVRIILEQICIVCVNVFVLISGWFGIKPSLKGVTSLLYQIIFFSLLVTAIISLLGNINLSQSNTLLPLYFGAAYWFIPAYLLLYIISPILNAFIEKTSPKVQFFILTSFFTAEFVYDWIYIDYANFAKGYSALSFIGLYLLARFIKFHSERLKRLSITNNILLYLLLTIIPALLFYFTKYPFNITHYSSPFVIGASLFLLLAFVKMQFQNKFINYLSCSVFSIYLTHQHPLVIPYFRYIMRTAYETLGGWLYILFVFAFAFILLFSCVMLDKLRIISWNYLYKTIISKTITKIEVLFLKIYEWIIN